MLATVFSKASDPLPDPTSVTLIAVIPDAAAFATIASDSGEAVMSGTLNGPGLPSASMTIARAYPGQIGARGLAVALSGSATAAATARRPARGVAADRKSTRLNSSH